MTRHLVRALAIAALAALAAIVASCQTGTVVLLPAADGKDSALVVKQRDGQMMLAEPYAATRLTTAGPRGYKATRRRLTLFARRSRRSLSCPSGSRSSSSRARTN
jgi:hypothetical protein